MTVSVPTSGTYNSKPVIDSATAIDTNEATIALTDDNSRLVKYFSDVKVKVEGRCLNYAGFSKLRENNVIDIPATTTTSNGTTTVTGEKIFEKSTNTEYKIVLVDTRQLASEYKILNEANGDFTLIPYIPLTISANVERVSPTSNSIKLNFLGNFYNGYYDEAKSNFNDLTIKWRYKESGSWITEGADDTENGWHNLSLGTDFKYNENENKYSSIDDVIIEDLFDYQKNYTIEILYEDRLASYKTQQPILAGIPNHDYGKDANGNNYFNANGEYYRNGVALLDIIYPIGSIYMSVQNINPSNFIGGTWEAWGAGKVPVGVDTSQTEFATVEQTGGEKTHTLTISEMPTHNHNLKLGAGSASGSAITHPGAQSTYYNYNEIVGNAGGSQAHNNLQPYITCYMWKRTA